MNRLGSAAIKLQSGLRVIESRCTSESANQCGDSPSWPDIMPDLGKPQGLLGLRDIVDLAPLGGLVPQNSGEK